MSSVYSIRGSEFVHRDRDHHRGFAERDEKVQQRSAFGSHSSERDAQNGGEDDQTQNVGGILIGRRHVPVVKIFCQNAQRTLVKRATNETETANAICCHRVQWKAAQMRLFDLAPTIRPHAIQSILSTIDTIRLT